MLPAGYKLLVREHKGNWGRRFGRWLKQVTRFPRTILTHPYDFQFPYIANADLIITDNGTAGWEGLMLGKPVVTVERTFYDPVGLAVPCKDINKLDKTILEALKTEISQEERDHQICLFIDADHETTIDIEEAKSTIDVTLDHIDKLLARRQG